MLKVVGVLQILGAAVLFFGPETLKGLAKEAGKARADEALDGASGWLPCWV